MQMSGWRPVVNRFRPEQNCLPHQILCAPETGIGEPMNTLLSVLDFCGTFVFAISGATAGVRRRLDLFGVLVLSFAAANSGGITRDLLIGAVPPLAVEDWRYA